MTTLHMHNFAGGLIHRNEKAYLALLYGDEWADKSELTGMCHKTHAQTKAYLAEVVPGEFYSFIVTTESLPLMEEIISTFGLEPYIHHRSSNPATNAGHSSLGPRLTVFIFKFPPNPTFKDI